MKYAFIVLIAIYLVIYGCSPDSSEKAKDSHEKTAPAAVVIPQQSEMVAVPEQQAEPVTPTHELQQQTADAKKQAVVVEQQTGEIAESQQVVMPCGQMMDEADIPENAPCLKPQAQLQSQIIQNTSDKKAQDLAIAMQKMMETTNNMVLATKQLVITTQEMLNASKGVAVEGIDTGKGIVVTKQETIPVGQSVEAQQPAAAITEKDVVKTMQDVVTAAQELIEATNKAISTTLEAKQKQ
jgi:hypothetical protein